MQIHSDATASAVVMASLCNKRRSFLYSLCCVILLLTASSALQWHRMMPAGSLLRLTSEKHSGSVASLLEMLAQQTGYSFFYDKEELSALQSPGRNFTQTTLGKVLLLLHQRNGLVYKTNR